jgi:hypothetical protein
MRPGFMVRTDREILAALRHAPSVSAAARELGYFRQTMKARCVRGELRAAYEACRFRGESRNSARWIRNGNPA